MTAAGVKAGEAAVLGVESSCAPGGHFHRHRFRSNRQFDPVLSLPTELKEAR